jgi:anti-anti-sigma factor
MPLQPSQPFLHMEAASGAAVVRPTEEAFQEPNVDMTGERLFRLADELGPQTLQLDLVAVRFLTSLGLGKLITLHKRAANAGGRLTLTGVCPLVYEVFDVTRLTLLLDVHRGGAEDVEAA